MGPCSTSSTTCTGLEGNLPFAAWQEPPTLPQYSGPITGLMPQVLEQDHLGMNPSFATRDLGGLEGVTQPFCALVSLSVNGIHNSPSSWGLVRIK